MGVNSESVLERIEDAKRHGLLHLDHSNLSQCPLQVFALSTSLVRLDLSANLITTLPEAISSLVNLQFLWLSDNPRLKSLPPTLSQCSQLCVLDVHATALHSLPCELARLSQLVVLDIGATPVEQRWKDKGHLWASAGEVSPFSTQAQQNKCQCVLRKLKRKDERTRLKIELYDKLHDEIYRIKRSDLATDACAKQTIRRLMKLFPESDEMRNVIRNAERLFPSITVGASLSDALEGIDSTKFRAKFDKLKIENERKKRAADLELKIRALYFDRIDPKLVEPMVQSIYAEIKELADVKFLIKHATELFPKDPENVEGKGLYRRVLALQQEMAQERQAAIDKVLAAVKAIYIDTEPEQVQQLVTGVVTHFKNTKDLLSLAADASAIFPSEFLNAQAAEIRATFVCQKAEALGSGQTGKPARVSPSASKKSRARE